MRSALAVVLSLGFALAVEAQTVVRQGNWTHIDYDVAGEWRIVAGGDALSVVLGDDFETPHGPDLHILLSRKSLSELTDENASAGALVVGALTTTDNSFLFRKTRGAQTLPLPADVDLGAWRTILIHCVKHSHLWAGANL